MQPIAWPSVAKADLSTITTERKMAKHRLFSKRNQVHPGVLITTLPEEFKTRLVHLLDELCAHSSGGASAMLSELEALFLKEYGGLRSSSYHAARMSDIPVIEHFFSSGLEHSLDFIEALFLVQSYSARQGDVDTVNELFDELHIGFRLSNYVEHTTKTNRGGIVNVEYPTIIPVTEGHVFQAVVRPALDVLSGAGYEVCNSELLDAFSSSKSGDFAESITKACSAFESFLKTLCTKHSVPFDAQRDTCSRLVKALVGAQIIPEFYTSALESIGTIRNKIGSAHGRGPVQGIAPGLEHAEHLFNLVCAHVVFLHDL